MSSVDCYIIFNYYAVKPPHSARSRSNQSQSADWQVLILRNKKAPFGAIILGRKDSNLRMPGPKPGALPLGDAPIILNFHATCVLSTRQTKTHSSLSLSGLCTHQTNACKLAKSVVATPQYSFVTLFILHAQSSLSINKGTFFICPHCFNYSFKEFFKYQKY